MEAFLRNPIGRWVADDTVVCWMLDRRLYGMALLGIPGDAGIRRVLSMYGRLSGQTADEPCDVVTDLRGLHAVAPSAFGALVDGAARSRKSPRIHRLAVVRPRSTLLAALAAGYLADVGTTGSHRLFAAPLDALAWLGVRAAGDIAAAMDALLRHAAGVTPLIDATRAAIRARLRVPSPPAIAAALGFAEPELGRALRAQGTSLAREINAVRVLEIKRRLLMGDEPLSAVAMDVGCASLQHMTIVFRRAEEMSPSEWRQRQRGVHSRGGGKVSAQGGLLASSSRMSNEYDGAPSNAHARLLKPQPASPS